jgi:hypothetical protein
MAIQTKVAPLGAPRTGVSIDQLLALQGQATTSMGAVPAPVEDPRSTVQATVDQYMPNPMDVPPPSAPSEEVLAATPTIRTFEDVATASGSRFGARPVEEPVLDAEGNAVVDPDTGAPQMRTVMPEDYANQQAVEKASQLNTMEAMEGMSQDPYGQAKDATTALLSGKQDAMFNASAREVSKSSMDTDEIDRYSDKTATALATIVSQTNDALFTANARIKSEMKGADGSSVLIAAGLKAAAEDGFSTPEELADFGLVFGVALAKSASQGKVEKGEKEGTGKVMSESGASIDDATYMLDFINSVKHFATNGLNRMGKKVSPKAINEMAKAVVMDAIDRGDVKVFHINDRPVVQMSPGMKDIARDLQIASEALVGDYGRRRSSSTPNRSGTSFAANRPQLTKRSVKKNDLVTTAAEATKDILGSVGLQFGAKDVQYKEIELGLVTSPEYIVRDDQGKIKFSNHWAAKRLGVSEKDFNAAKMKTKPEKDFNPADPEAVRRFEARQEYQATEVINNKLKTIAFDIENAKKSPGIRYSEWVHSLANQRFFPNSFDVDYMGSKNATRDMLGFALKEYVSSDMLFDPAMVDNLKQKAVSILRQPGDKQNASLEALTPAERGAIGTMINAVINYYSAVEGSNPEIVKESPASIISKYTPAIADKLAEVGKDYNAFLADPTNASENIQELLAGMEKGESMGSKNLWDDMFNLKAASLQPETKRKQIPLTHHSFDDGNQNGIFLQALFFGSPDNAIRLGTFNPSLSDMREYAMNTMIANLEDNLKDNPEANDAFRNFFKAIRDKYGKAAMAKDFFKKPLMQNAYGKDASMFGDMMVEILTGIYPEEAQQYLLDSTAFGRDIDKAAAALSDALESTLREVINSKSTQVLKDIGRYTAILNQTVMMPGITGDTYVLTPTEVMPINKANDSGEIQPIKLADGSTVMVKYKAYEADTFIGSDGQEITVESSAMGYSPAASKGSQLIYNQRTKKYDVFNNAIGTSQSRQMVVMPIQSIDGDLVKSTTLSVNKNRSTPVPIMWVHDSAISTPGGSLLYRNAYNNVSIPKAIPQIAKFGNQFAEIIKNSEEEVFNKIMDRGRPVSIGDQGDFPALGSYLDEQFERVQDDGAYKQIFLKRAYNNPTTWLKYQQKTNAILKEAEANGWKAPRSIPDTANMSGEQIRRHLAVTPRQFKNLVGLTKEMLKLSGPSNRFDPWVSNFSKNVNDTASKLMTAAKKDGIGQMTYGATGERGDITKAKGIADEKAKSFDDSDIAYANRYENAYMSTKSRDRQPKSSVSDDIADYKDLNSYSRRYD